MRIRDVYVSRPRILVVGGDPRNINNHNIGELALSEEFKTITRELQGARYRDFKARFAHTTTIDELMQHLNDPKLSIVHIAAHGVGAHSPAGDGMRDLAAPGPAESEGNEFASGVYLLDTERRRRLLTMTDLAKMIGYAAPSIRLAVLNACHSATQAEALCETVDCVIAIDGPIGDRAAIAFAAAFYRALASRKSVGNAFSQAVATLDVKRLPEKPLMKCYTKPGIDAAELYLGPAPSAARSGSSKGRGRRGPARRRSRAACVVAGGLAMALAAAAMGVALLSRSNAPARGEPPAPIPVPSVDPGGPIPNVASSTRTDLHKVEHETLKPAPKPAPRPRNSPQRGTRQPPALEARVQRRPLPGPPLDAITFDASRPQEDPPLPEFTLRPRTSSAPIVPDDSPRDLNRATVQRLVNLHRTQLTECYDRRLLVDPTITGTVTARYQITPEGSVTSLTVTGMDKQVSDCIAHVVRTIQFPRSTGSTWVTSPLEFKPRER